MGEHLFTDWLLAVRREYLSHCGRPFDKVSLPGWMLTDLLYDITNDERVRLSGDLRAPYLYPLVIEGWPVRVEVITPASGISPDAGRSLFAVVSWSGFSVPYYGLVTGTVTAGDAYVNGAAVYHLPITNLRPLRPFALAEEERLMAYCRSN